MGRLTGRTAIITGATSGIGRTTALRFASEGAQLVLTGRRADRGEAVAEECRLLGARCIFIQADQVKEEDCRRVMDAAVREFGRIHILFNNAGIVTGGTAETTTEEVWNETFAINVTAVWRMCRQVLPHMRLAGGGVIINNGSDWSVVAGKDAFPYIASKGAVAMMTRSLALDYAPHNIRVNAVCPGDTLVERWMEKGYFEGSGAVSVEEAMRESSAYLPMGRFGRPEEIAGAVLFLASDDSSFVTGHLLMVDGGNTAQ